MTSFKADYLQFEPMVNKLKENYNFQGLWHFTDFTNLNSIFDAGELSSRQTCLDNKISFLDGANHDVLDRADAFVHNCTRFYYRPKTPTLYVNEGVKSIEYSNEVHIPRPVYLLFSPQLIYSINSSFSNGNATNSPIGSTAEFFEGMDWDNIFHSTWFNGEDRDNIINKRHAELLSSKPVNLKYITNVIFRSNADLQQAIGAWGEHKKFVVNESYFSDKSKLLITHSDFNNYIEDYNIKYSATKLELIVILKKPIENYKITWSIQDKKGSSKNNIVNKVFGYKFTDILNNVVTGQNEAIKVTLTYDYSPSDGDVIKIYFNSVLSIIETIIMN